jgi:hypothetical protein
MGLQSLILRKGGIDEESDGFKVLHREFWLFPTGFHQQPEDLTEPAWPILERLKAKPPTPGIIAIGNYIQVIDVIEIEDESKLPRLKGLHIWSDETLQKRFHYRMPKLFALLARAYRRPTQIYIPELSHFAGCHSWVDFPIEIETGSISPVITDAQHNEQMERIRAALL